ncbi:acyl-CoA dehydrogenase family protein [Brevibacterium ravenspurgense]|uniref:acyl-CoA dehydrogenase family protein n=1 Tax=Brevibacterium ravenspurgense TaxID=479117 RepID=UPI001EF34BF9|nr:acyl-CoA dehydrogenase family protein [Brevibacterium ravenspurgense]MCG7301371.1 acyl-CoA dehydrogenase family protein [Brevibacterium ravenspurgense]
MNDLDAFRKTAATFVEKEINPHVDDWEANGIEARPLWKKAGDLGLLGLSYDPEYGGGGAPLLYSIVLAEELGKADAAGPGLGLTAHANMATPTLNQLGTPEQKEKYLAPANAGDHIAAIGVTEPDAGSDVAGIRTSAVKNGGDWVINGEKTFITNASNADWVCMLVRTSDEGGFRGMSQIIVPTDAEGFEVVRVLDKLGNRSSDTCEIRMTDCRVPTANTIGTEGRGFQQQMLQFLIERISGSASTVGACDRALQRTRDYMNARPLFGSTLAAKQYPVFKITELQAEVELLREAVYSAAHMVQQGKDVTRLASAAKLKAGRLARETADYCLQVHGGMGYMEENWTARYMRDSRLTSIGGGADEVMLQVLAKLDGFTV